MGMFIVKVKKIGRYRDGGTIHYQDNDGNDYWVDGRTDTPTKGFIFDKYPDKEGAKRLHVVLITAEQKKDYE